MAAAVVRRGSYDVRAESVRRERRRRVRSSSSSGAEESSGTEDDFQRNLDTSTTTKQEVNKTKSEDWQLLDSYEPCNEEEMVKSKLKFFFMNMADKFHFAKTVPSDLCLQVKLHLASSKVELLNVCRSAWSYSSQSSCGSSPAPGSPRPTFLPTKPPPSSTSSEKVDFFQFFFLDKLTSIPKRLGLSS